MINVCTIAPHAALLEVALRELPKLRALNGQLNSHDITGYKVVANDLWAAQFFKCCYCEIKLPKSFNDVDHYRPKARADRRPGCTSNHGYWWLAFNRNNLLFSCPSCNRSSKGDRFPLDIGSVAMLAEQIPPLFEVPLLIDPVGAINPVEHIQFMPMPGFTNLVDRDLLVREVEVVRWFAVPRRGSKYGRYTIEVVDLNRMELLELRSDYFRTSIWPLVLDLQGALEGGFACKVEECLNRAKKLISRRLPFTALAFDSLVFFVPQAKLDPYRLAWPSEAEVGRI